MTDAERFLWGVQTAVLLYAQTASEKFTRMESQRIISEALRVSEFIGMDKYLDVPTAVSEFCDYFLLDMYGRAGARPRWFDVEGLLTDL